MMARKPDHWRDVHAEADARPPYVDPDPTGRAYDAWVAFAALVAIAAAALYFCSGVS